MNSETTQEKEGDDLTVGDPVYICASISELPRFGSNMYRLVTKDEGIVLWAKKSEIIPVKNPR